MEKVHGHLIAVCARSQSSIRPRTAQPHEHQRVIFTLSSKTFFTSVCSMSVLHVFFSRNVSFSNKKITFVVFVVLFICLHLHVVLSLFVAETVFVGWSTLLQVRCGHGCSGSRIESVCHKNTHQFFNFFLSERLRRTRGDDGERSSKWRRLPRNFDDNCGNCGRYGQKSETCWATFPTTPAENGHGSKIKEGKQVEVLGEQETAGEHTVKDIGGLSNGLCTVRFDVMSDDVGNDGIEVTRRQVSDIVPRVWFNEHCDTRDEERDRVE